MLAGNVTAAVSGGNLVLTGDASSNLIQVSQTSPGTWKVQGIGTKVNGSSAAQTFPGVSGISADLDGGNNSLQIFNGTLTNAVTVTTANGNDTVIIANLTVGNNLTVDVGSGTNAVSVTNASIGGSLTVLTGAKNDSVAVANITLTSDCIVTDTGGTNVFSFTRINSEGAR